MTNPKTFLILCIFLNSYITAQETSCKAQGNQIGYCALYENCPQFHNVMLYKGIFNNPDCRQSGLIGAVLCCPHTRSESSTKTSSTVISTTTPTPQTTPQPLDLPSRIEISTAKTEELNPNGLALLNQHKCGRILTDRVANGVNAGLDELPWVAMLLYGATLKPLCGGSIIAERWVLTAAHCIRGDLQLIRLGEHKFSTNRDCITDNLCVTHQEFGIEKTIVHPEFDSQVYYKDIALIKLNDTVQFQTAINIKPICLPTQPQEFAVTSGNIIIIAGWGLKEDGQQADVLQKGSLTFEQVNVCRSVYSRYLVDDSKICTRAGINDTVSCRGDSGGPLFWKTGFRTARGRSKQRYTQIGVVSTGFMYRCGGLTRIPFMFENVTNSMAWLTNAISS